MSSNLVSRNLNENVQNSSYVPFTVNFSALTPTNIVIPGYGLSLCFAHIFSVSDLGITNMLSVKSLQFTLDFNFLHAAPAAQTYSPFIFYVPDSGQLTVINVSGPRQITTGTIPITSNGATVIQLLKFADLQSPPTFFNYCLGSFIASNVEAKPYIFSSNSD